MGIGARRMVRWAVGGGLVRGAGGARVRPARASGIPVMGRRLVELVLRDGLRSREIEGRGLIEVGPTLRVGAPAWGGPRAGVKRGGRCGRSRWRRTRSTVARTVMNERIRISPPQAGHRSGSTS